MRYLTADHLGSPRINTDGSGNVVARHDYMPFGEEISTSQRTSTVGYPGTSDGIRKQFTGYERDGETGLDFAEARMYASPVGRFASADPLMASATVANPQTLNRFTYVNNSPSTLTDPLGLVAESSIACGNRCANSETSYHGGAFDGPATDASFDWTYDETGEGSGNAGTPTISLDKIQLVDRIPTSETENHLALMDVLGTGTLAGDSGLVPSPEISIAGVTGRMAKGSPVYLRLLFSVTGEASFSPTTENSGTPNVIAQGPGGRSLQIDQVNLADKGKTLFTYMQLRPVDGAIAENVNSRISMKVTAYWREAFEATALPGGGSRISLDSPHIHTEPFAIRITNKAEQQRPNPFPPPKLPFPPLKKP